MRLRTFGLHNARNAAAALAVTKALGLPLDAAAAALEEVHPVGDRGRVRAIGRHALIADCYNANPASMEVALRSFAALEEVVAGPRVAVLGDMRALGPGSPDFHREVGAQVAETGVDLLVGVGPQAAHAVASASDRGVAAVAVGLDEVEAAVDAVFERLEGAAEAAPGAVLVKASRGVRLERVVEALRALSQVSATEPPSLHHRTTAASTRGACMSRWCPVWPNTSTWASPNVRVALSRSTSASPRVSVSPASAADWVVRAVRSG